MADVPAWFHDPDDPHPLESLSADLQLFDDLPGSPSLFVVPLSGALNGNTFYFGILTPYYEASDGRTWTPVRSPGFVFTRWGTMDRGYARPAKGGHYFASDHEGKHISVRAPGRTTRGRYTFTVKVVEVVTEGRNSHVWVGGYVYSHATGRTDHVGDLRFDGPKLTQRHSLTSFLEVVAEDDRTQNTSDTMPELKVAVGRWAMDGKPVKANTIWAQYPEQVPQKARAFVWDKRPEGDVKGLAREMREGQTVVIALQDKVLSRKGFNRREIKQESPFGEPFGWYTQETLFERRP
ncbi:hypothetical protein R5W24_005444 [Gemmata sp. JC717]|uniref:hypothetical protein n=1 Tax=Gemmata algarum TaxID=2975278 RepID=UPI0021BB9890|nr:hypothetical protein [Gemmata algarum]MDY3556281.1 hypothetical protein [Gemmata algarum]